jgi:hypothetical protein
MNVIRQAACLLGVIASAELCQAGAHVFVLQQAADGLTVKKVPLNEGETKVFICSADTGYIDIILPVGPGGSGSMCRWADRRVLIARRVGDELRITDRGADGKEWQRPARKLDDLAEYDIRVSVSGASGDAKSFLVSGYEEAGVDPVGPVVDIFAGKIPMNSGDFTIFTDTYRRRVGSETNGMTSLEIDRWPFAVGKLQGGSEGLFLVDIGAGTSLVSRDFLPATTKISKAAMAQFTSGGKKMLKYAPGGATGSVENILGHATLPELRFGTISFKDAQVDVIREMPDFFGRPVAGILGIDLLRRCRVLSLCLSGDDGSEAHLRLAATPGPAGSAAVELPFTFVTSHLVVDGQVNGQRVHFVLDTGAPNVFLDAEAARRLGIATEAKTARPGHGLDGGTVDIVQGGETTLTIADKSYGGIQPEVSALAAFVTLRTNGQNAGLLGNSFFSGFQRIEFDFDRCIARFVEK